MAQEVALTGKKVLIIEDDPLLHNLLAVKMEGLRKKGLEVYPMLTAEDGLNKAREAHPDLVLLDLILPGMSGFEFLEQVRKDETLKKTPVLVLSNLSGEDDKNKAKSFGVLAYIVKANFSLGEISDLIEKTLRGEQFQAPGEGDKDAQGVVYI